MSKAISFDVDLCPPAMNLLLRKHWSYRKNQKTLWMGIMHAKLGRFNLATLRAWRELKHRVHVELQVSHKRAFDPDNLVSCAKIPLDALKELNCLVDDNSKWIDLSVTEVVGSTVGTSIRITNLSAMGGNGKSASQVRFIHKHKAAP